VNVFDLPGGRKLQALAFRPDAFGTGSYISYLISGHVKFTISDAGGADSALSEIFLDSVHN
jgi:hypothetical protein